MSDHAAAPAFVVGMFPDGQTLKRAVKAVHAEGYRRFDVHTPHPVHGMDEAMGLGRSRLGWIVTAGAIAGVAAGFGLAWFTSVFDYPVITGGKPYGSWPAFLVVTFETGVLGASGAAVLGMLGLNRLPQWHHPVLASGVLSRVSDDAYVLVIGDGSGTVHAARAQALIEKLGASEVRLLSEDGGLLA